MRCGAYYYLSANRTRTRTNDKCQSGAEWRIEWLTSSLEWKGIPVCRYHIMTTHKEAMEEGAHNGDVHLLTMESRYDWVTGSDTVETRVEVADKATQEAAEGP